MTTMIKQRNIPEAGIFIALSADGKLYKKRPDPRHRTGGYWAPYDEDILSLALEGRTLELQMVQELLA